MDVRQRVGRNLKKYRKEAGFSQEGLALECGLHRTYVSGVERGVRNPTVVVLEQIAKPLGIPSWRLQLADSIIYAKLNPRDWPGVSRKASLFTRRNWQKFCERNRRHIGRMRFWNTPVDYSMEVFARSGDRAQTDMKSSKRHSSG